MVWRQLHYQYVTCPSSWTFRCWLSFHSLCARTLRPLRHKRSITETVGYSCLRCREVYCLFPVRRPFDRSLRAQEVSTGRYHGAADCFYVYRRLLDCWIFLNRWKFEFFERGSYRGCHFHVLCWNRLGNGLELHTICDQCRDFPASCSLDRLESFDVFPLCESVWHFKGICWSARVQWLLCADLDRRFRRCCSTIAYSHKELSGSFPWWLCLGSYGLGVCFPRLLVEVWRRPMFCFHSRFRGGWMLICTGDELKARLRMTFCGSNWKDICMVF